MATIISVVLLNLGAVSVPPAEIAVAEVQQPAARDSLSVWLDELVEFESSGVHSAKVLDVNGKYSYGCLQFQMATFLGAAKKYAIDVGDAETTIFDCELQKKIAREMLENEPRAWRNWYTSIAVRGLRMPPIIQ